jgi:hypothetical protein
VYPTAVSHRHGPPLPHFRNHPPRAASGNVSGCLRTLAGAEQFCLIRSYLATTAKHGTGLMNALTQLAHGHPWLPATI